jgi:hypothetical protein
MIETTAKNTLQNKVFLNHLFYCALSFIGGFTAFLLTGAC